MQRIRIAVVVLVLSALALDASAQDRDDSASFVTRREWHPLRAALRANDWQTASELSARYLTRLQTDTLDQAPRLRYIFLLSSAGLVADGHMSFEKLEQRLESLQGQRIVLQGYTIAESQTNGFGQIRVSEHSDSVAVSMAPNNDGTTILCFEYVRFSNPLDLSGHLGNLAQLSGILEKIELNPNKSNIWILRLFLKEGEIEFLTGGR